MAQNLTVKPAKLIETYQAAEDPKQFHRSILNSKPKAVFKRGKQSSNSTPVIDAENSANNDQEETVDESYEIVDVASEGRTADTGLNPAHSADDGEEVRLRLEIKMLTKQLMEKEEAYTLLETQFNEINAELAVIEEGLLELKEIVQRALEMCENGAGDEYLAEALRNVLDTVRKVGS